MSIVDRATAEAEQRWPQPNITDPLPSAWLDKGMAAGFVLGAQYAATVSAEQIEAAAAALFSYEATAAKSEDTWAEADFIDKITTRARVSAVLNGLGLRVEDAL